MLKRHVNYIYKYQELFEKIDKETIVITANTRLQGHMERLYLKYMHDKKNYVSLRENFINFRNFVDILYDKALIFDPLLEQIISDYEAQFLLFLYLKEDQQIFMPSIEQAKNVFSAWRTLQDWFLRIEDIEGEVVNTNVKFFLKWIKKLQGELRKRNWIDISQCLQKLMYKQDILQKIFLNLGYQKIIIFGFDTLTPLMDKFFNYLQKKFKISVNTWCLPNIKSNVKFTEYWEDRIEIEKVAEAVFKLNKCNHNATIGVIVPDLQSQFHNLVNAFDKYFVTNENKKDPLLDNGRRKYTISGGESLFSQPIVYQLLLWLDFNRVTNFGDIKVMLNSSFIKDHEIYKEQRLKHIIKLKAKLPISIHFYELIMLKLFKDDCDITLLTIIKNLVNFKKYQTKCSVFEFIQNIKCIINNQLEYIKGCTLSSLEYQALSQFYKVLNKMIFLSRLELRFTFDEWLKELQSLLHDTLFQTQTNNNSNIHILGMLESTGFYFDYLFVIRMSDKNWPNLSNMNPYLPISFQKKNNMPHSSADRELEVTYMITKRLMNQSKTIFFSYSLLNEEKLQILSPLLKPSSSIKIDHETLHDKQSKNFIYFKTFQDNTLPAVKSCEFNEIKGNSQLFKHIAECPYRTALIYRLQISPDKPHDPIFSASEKGIVIHHILEKLWHKFRSSKNLNNCSNKDLSVMLEKQIKITLNCLIPLVHIIPKLIKKVEVKRLKKIVSNWFNYEKTRKTPFKILALEKHVTSNILGITVKSRLDRIDFLESGHKIIIDYKTSKQNLISDLLKSPLFESQLPLYAAIHADVDAVALATVNGTHINLKSISSISDWIGIGNPKQYSDKNLDGYKSLKQYWKNELILQMQDFISGNSLLTPSIENCKYCEFSVVCRVKKDY